MNTVGFWRRDIGPQATDPRRHVDPHWDRTQRDAVVRYLGLGRIAQLNGGRAECRICHGAYGSADLTDGEWAWSEVLVHYVSRHDVRPDQEFVDWVLGHGAVSDA
jgi:mono/diheme cytochrome c family protein